MNLDRILHGGDYNPEQWFVDGDYKTVIEKDIVDLKAAGINFVTVGVFSWACYNPADDVYDFEYMDYLIKRFKEEGFSIVLSTPSGGFPNWLKIKYPSINRVDKNNVRRTLGDRHNHCFNSPDTIREITKINNKLAERYKSEDIVLWHISNEMQGECYCEHCIAKFQGWLETRYKNIENLNKEWNMVFWSHKYNSFKEVFPPFDHGDGSNPCMRLAWTRFTTDSAIDMYNLEVEAIKQHVPNAKHTTNLCYGLGHNYNYSRFAQISDIVSWDSYHEWHKQDDYETALYGILNFDIMRGFKQQNFFMMESTPNTANWRDASKNKRPKVNEITSMLAIAFGSQSVGYFQMKRSRNHAEMFHSAIIDDFVYENRFTHELKQLGTNLNSIEEILDTTIKNDVAVVFDYEIRDIINYNVGPRKGSGMPYCEYFEEIHRAFTSKGINVDAVSLNNDLSKYQAVIIPMHFMLSEKQLDMLTEISRNGTKLYITSFTGITDEENTLQYSGRNSKFRDLIGNNLLEAEAIYNHDHGMVNLGTNKVETKLYHEYVKPLEQTEVLGTYEFDMYDQSPAITRNGNCTFFAAIVDGDVISNQVIADLNLEKDNSKMIVQTRSNDKHEFEFHFNFTNELSIPKSTGELVVTNSENIKAGLNKYEYVVYKITK